MNRKNFLQRKINAGFKVNEILPPEYQRVEWVGSEGSTVVNLATGLITEADKPLKIEMEIQPVLAAGSKWLLGTPNNFAGQYKDTTTNKYYYCLNYGTAAVISTEELDYNHFQKVVFTCDCSSTQVTETLTINDHEDTKITRTATAAAYGGHIFILSVAGNINGSTSFRGKIRLLKIYKDNVLVRNYIPCYNTKNGVPGFYDTVEKIFYVNAVNVSPLKGNSINTPNAKNTGLFDYTIIGNSKDILPKEYQQVEYIQSDGTQYINTNFLPNNNSKLEIKAQRTTSGAESGIIHSGVGYSNQAFGVYFGGTGSVRTKYWSGYGTSDKSNDSVSQFTEFVAVQDKNKVYINDTLIITHPENTFQSTVPLTIFAENRSTGAIKMSRMKAFYCKLWDNDILVRYMIPCYRKADNEIGMYDVVNRTFYKNDGTGVFTCGNDVNYYEECDYIQAAGGPYPYFRIPYKINTSTKIETKVCTPTSRNTYVFGTSDYSQKYCRLLLNSSSQFAFNYFDGPYATSFYSGVESNTDYTIVFDCKNKKITVNDTDYTITITPTIQQFSSDLFIGALKSYTGYTAQNNWFGKLYYFKIYENDVLIHNYISVYQKLGTLGAFKDTITGEVILPPTTTVGYTPNYGGTSPSLPTATQPIENLTSVGDYNSTTGKYDIPVKVYDGTYWGKVDLGTLDYTTTESSGMYTHKVTISDLFPSPDSAMVFQGFCDMYNPVSVSSTLENLDMSWESGSQSQTVVLVNSAYTTASDFKEAMKGVYLYYALNTTTVGLPPQASITTISLDEPLRTFSGYYDSINFQKGQVTRNIVKADTTHWISGVSDTNNILVRLYQHPHGCKTMYNGITCGCTHTISTNPGYLNMNTELAKGPHITQYISSNQIFLTLPTSVVGTTFQEFQTWVNNHPEFEVWYITNEPYYESISLPNIDFGKNDIIKIDTLVKPSNLEYTYVSNVKE